MAGAYKTPGVYIVEKDAFPNSVVEVDTAVPAFIGYTEKAQNKGLSLINKPFSISSMAEYENYFGGAPNDSFKIKKLEAELAEKDKKSENTYFSENDVHYEIAQEGHRYYLYHSMKLFFQNGGGKCFIVSVGKFADKKIERSVFESALDELLKEQEPTMVVIPDAMSLGFGDCNTLQQLSLAHCGERMKNRFAILDVHQGYQDKNTAVADADEKNCITQFRNKLGTSFMAYGAAYYPWVNTSIVQVTDLRFTNFINLIDLKKILSDDIDLTMQAPNKKAEIKEIISKIPSGAEGEVADPEYNAEELHKSLFNLCPMYKNVLTVVQEKLNLLPPAAAMAGVYTRVDNSRGVWKAPANVSLSAVLSPVVNISHDDQEDLNVSTTGKSINAVRAFIGEGTLVWGARTLDGNSLDWRYINVRRTMIMLEESIRLATKAYVFEPNVDNTWITIKSMISNFLTSIWKRGGLAGASPEDAFSVHVGLGETMTAVDILEGIMRVTVLVALSRPAEFIEITFQQQMQKS
ncbi:phage tail sheath family protein [Undibacterium flavidum]|uniref:Phage tail sheath family protein n=1 Tax=Undibacterium flavidum TaxID=2762297 RepID=A0ABR6YFE6_9BURK|nr:phage tail sheath C-terminal domain-containing protein [Undibacterium flavidum]MBC3875300.1 phage tail sheath family protein [Undibacterium flavidum]